MKYILQSVEENANHAGPKAKSDIRDIFIKKGYKAKTFLFPTKKFEKIVRLPKVIRETLSDIADDDTVVLQFPTGFQTKGLFDRYLLKKLRKKQDKVVIVHDLEGLRQQDSSKLKSEISFLNQFRLVVLHNEKMTQICRKNGLTTEVIEIGLFDYLVTDQYVGTSNINPKKLNFAGNLDKSEFISKLNLLHLKNGELNLFGPTVNSKFEQNIVYHGSIPSDDIPAVLEKNGGFGLIWDGYSLDSCEGKNGEYLKYNNPHKLSLYIASKIPVICWEKAAIASFVKEKNIGILIGNLNELDAKLSEITTEEYMNMKNNIDAISENIVDGYYTKRAIKAMESVS
ncbi:hypothetical protein MKL22_11305 [Enterococcus faecium]|uniref:hypothetical protein n=1 Tax=Enterococcus faecium TaxID=1352 RepID=UPI001F051A38|nr:hypothetical protein [Enterococcus faecium]MCH1661867.1 hypothetical protein [Enterococcus faecium]WDW18509.1 hypothetical protein PWA42_04555 [Enterococcus faecium]